MRPSYLIWIITKVNSESIVRDFDCNAIYRPVVLLFGQLEAALR